MSASWGNAKGVGPGSRAWIVMPDGTQRLCDITTEIDSETVTVSCPQYTRDSSDNAVKEILAQFRGAILHLE